MLCVRACVQADDMARFMFFSRASLEFLVVTGRQPDVLHLHDWQSSTVVRARHTTCCSYRGFLFDLGIECRGRGRGSLL